MFTKVERKFTTDRIAKSAIRFLFILINHLVLIVSALHVAASAGNLRATKYLIEHKANFRIKNAEGKTPADICTNFHTKNYLVGISLYRGNPRRISRNALYSISSTKPLPTIALPQLISNTREQLNQSMHLTVNQRNEYFFLESTNNVDQHIQLDTFLIVVRMILWLFGSNRRKNNLMPQHHISENQIDVIAKAAAYTHVDLKE